MVNEKNFTLQGKTSKPIITDVYYETTYKPKPIVIFCHGYKGFKDWGAWNLMAEKFAKNGFFFIKFNFSHNGGTPEQPIDFPDLEAFSEDNYSKQLDDLESVIDWIITTRAFVNEADVQNVNLIGHSRGGGIVLLKSAENDHITRIVTLAGVSDFASRFPQGDVFDEWKEKGVYYVKNGRTKQEMPHNFQFYEDFEAHKKRFDIKKAARKVAIPHLILHNSDDETVDVEEAHLLHKWNKRSQLELLKTGGHTFGAKHPWEQTFLPKELEKAGDIIIQFLNN